MAVKCSALSRTFITTHLQGLQMEEMEERMGTNTVHAVCWTQHGCCTQLSSSMVTCTESSQATLQHG